MSEFATSRTSAQASFLSLFLGPGDLPAEMRCVRDARDQDVPPPGGAVEGHGWKRAGWASWFAPGDADLYRVDDARWLFATPQRAARWYDHLVRESVGLGPPQPTIAEARLEGCAYGAPDRELVHLIAGELVVCRLRAVPGEGAVLPNEPVLALARVMAARLLFYLAGDSQERLPAWWAPH